MTTEKYSKTPKPKDTNLIEAIAGTAVAIVKALKESPDKITPTPSVPVGISPGKKALLSGQYLKLRDDCVLSATIFNNQKDRILDSIKSVD